MTLIQHPTRLSSSDRRHVYNLFRRMHYRHIHLDWRDLHQWLSSPMLRCWVIRRHGDVDSLLGATVHIARVSTAWGFDHTKIAWLRFMLPADPFGRDASLDALWQELKADLASSNVKRIALLSMEPWTGNIVKRWGFEQTTSVITLRRPRQLGIETHNNKTDYQMRSATSKDMAAIADVDAHAFSPIWQYSEETLRIAAAQSVSVSMLDYQNQVVGYQLSTLHSGSGHLARLAVVPEYQGKGYGKALVNYALRQFLQRNVYTITVNTQKDNIRSQRVYQRLGFKEIDHEVPVWELSLN